MFDSLKSKFAVATVALAPVAAFAEGAATSFDPSSYVAQITGTIAGILAVGAAVFGVYIAIKSTKWARRAL